MFWRQTGTVVPQRGAAVLHAVSFDTTSTEPSAQVPLLDVAPPWPT